MENMLGLSVLALLLYWIWLTLGQDIRRNRLARGWTQEKLAELVGVEPRSVQRWEADVSHPRPSHVYRLQQLELQLSLDHFRPKIQSEACRHTIDVLLEDTRNHSFVCMECKASYD